jgi:hypothetical protein
MLRTHAPAVNAVIKISLEPFHYRSTMHQKLPPRSTRGLSSAHEYRTTVDATYSAAIHCCITVTSYPLGTASKLGEAKPRSSSQELLSSPVEVSPLLCNRCVDWRLDHIDILLADCRVAVDNAREVAGVDHHFAEVRDPVVWGLADSTYC